jgi:hypothetical protein
MSSSRFDRVRPRVTENGHARLDPASAESRPDAEGRRALFSTEPPLPATGSIVVRCSRCGEASVLSPSAALRTALPSLHLPLLHRGHPSFLRCPACRRFSWVRLRLVT